MNYLLFFFFLFITPNASATIPHLVVNHGTKELYWAERSTSEEGFIGWEAGYL